MERAKRRQKQLAENSRKIEYQEILAQIQKRDEDDINRALAPLKPAEDAVVIDSSEMGIDEVVSFILAAINEKQK